MTVLIVFKKDRFAFIKGVPRCSGTPHKFSRHGNVVRSILRAPHLPPCVNAVNLSMHTDQFIMPRPFFPSTARLGRACPAGRVAPYDWEARPKPPGFVVLVSSGRAQASASLWGSAFLPTVYQVACRRKVIRSFTFQIHGDEPEPPPFPGFLEGVNQIRWSGGDPETLTNPISHYELAYRMQTIVPELMTFPTTAAHR